MSSEDELAWEILQCPECDTIAKCDPSQLVAPTCPSCGTLLSVEAAMPDPNELQLDEDDDSSAVSAPAALSGALISQLGSQGSSDPNLDPARIKSTTDDDLVSAAEDRIRVKRSSKRVKKELTGWDANADAEVQDSGVVHGKNRRLTWLMSLGVASIAVVPIAFVCLTAYGVFTTTKELEEEVKDRAPSEAELARASMSELEVASADRSMSDMTLKLAREVGLKFLAAPTWQERLAFVREPERVGPLMEKFYARPENADGPFVHRPMSQKGKVPIFKSLMLFKVETEEFEALPLAIERIDEDDYRVDWESFVGLNDVPWNEIKTLRPSDSFLVRARARKREYYNYGFQEDDWSSWQLEDRRGDYRLFGYTERGGDLEFAMRQQMSEKSGSVYVLLKVRFPENAPAGDQLEITEVIAKGWIHPGDD